MENHIRRRRFPGKRIFVGALALLAVLVLGTVAFLHTAYAGAWLLRRIDRSLRETTGVTVSAGQTRLRPFALAVQLKNVTLRSLEEGMPLRDFHAERVRVALSWSTVRGRDIHLREVHVVRPVLRMTFTPQARHIKETDRPAGADGGTIQVSLPVRVDALNLTDGALEIAAGDTFRLSLHGIQAGIVYDSPAKSQRGHVSAGEGQVILQERTMDLRRVATRFHYTGRRLIVDGFSLATTDSAFTGDADIDLSGAVPGYRLAGKGSLSIAEFSPFIESSPFLAGRVGLAVNAEGLGGDLQFRGRIQSEDIEVGRLGRSAFQASVEGDKNLFKVSAFNWSSPAGNILGSGAISLAEEKTARISLTWHDVELHRVQAFLPLKLPRLSAAAEGQLEASWPWDDLSILDAAGSCLLKPSAGGRFSAGPTLRPRGRIDLKLRKGRVEGNGFLAIAGTRVKFAGTASRDKEVRLQADFDSRDLAGTLQTLVPALEGRLPIPRGIPDFPKPGARMRGQVRVRGSLAAPRLALAVQGEDIAWGDVDLTAIRLAAEISYPGRTVGPPSLSFDLAAGPAVINGIAFSRITAAGGFSDGEWIVEPLSLESAKGGLEGAFRFSPRRGTFRAAMSGKEIALAAFAPFLPATRGLSGMARFEIKGEGQIRSPQGELFLTVSDLSVRGTPLPGFELRASADGRIGRSVLTVPALRLRLDAGLVLEKPYRVEGSLVLENLPFGKLAAYFPATSAGPAADPASSIAAALSYSLPLANRRDFRMHGDFTLADEGFLASRVPGWPADTPTRIAMAGHLSAHGDPLAPNDLGLDLEIRKFTLSTPDVSLSSQGIARVSLRDGRLALNDLSVASDLSAADLSGWVTLGSEPSMEGRLRMKLDLAQVDPFFSPARIGGALEMDVQLRGPVSGPRLRGRVEFRDVVALFREYPLNLSAVNGRLDFGETRAVFSDFRGIANGGAFTLAGAFERQGIGVSAPDSLRLELRNAYFNLPPGLHTVSDADLEMKGPWNGLKLSGAIRLLSGYYRQDLHPGVELISLLRNRPEAQGEDFPPLLFTMGLDIGVTTEAPLRIRNNMADIELDGRLKVSGTPVFPLLSGSLRNAGVGRVHFGDRDFTLETMTVEYLGTPPHDFSLDLVAHARMRHDLDDLDIRLQLSGPAANPTTTLTSNPSRSSTDLSLLLLTGKTLADIQGSALDTLGGQMVQLFASPLVSPLTSRLKGLLKAEDVIIEPLNIASEEDPGARFTFRKRVSDRVQATFSADITRSQRQTWIIDYDLSRSFTLSAFHKDDGTHGASFQHRFTIKDHASKVPAQAPRALAGATLAAVRLGGDMALPPRILDVLPKSLRTGRKFSYGAIHAVAEKLIVFCKQQGFLNAVVVPRIEIVGEHQVAVQFDVRTGRPAALTFAGDPLPSRLKREVREAWSGAFPENANLVESRALLLKSLRHDRYHAAAVTTEKRTTADGDRYVFTTRKGGRFKIAAVHVLADGSPLSTKEILQAIGQYPLAPTRGPWNLIIDGPSAIAALKRRFAELGHLRAVVKSPRVDVDPHRRSIVVSLEVAAGPLSRVGELILEGGGSLREELLSKMSIREGMPYSPGRLQEERNALLSFCRSRGYRDAKVTAIPRVIAGGPDMEIRFGIDAGSSYSIGAIEVTGNARTREKFILRKAALPPGAPVNLETFALSQKKLYETGLFKGVNIYSRTVAGQSGGACPVVIEVEESAPAAITYGLRYSSEEKVEAFAEGTFSNLFGGGRKGFLSYRENSRQSDLRFSLRAPQFFGTRLDALASLYRQKEIKDTFVSETLGGSIQQSLDLPMNFTLSCTYRLNRIHTYELESTGPFAFDISILLSEMILHLVRDTRNDRFNATSGSFLSASLTYAPGFLGSDLPYISFYTQYVVARKLAGKVTWLTGLRLGFADAFDQRLISSRRFFAGGGNSIRGFKLDSLGPRDPYLGSAEGGEAVLIVNNELTFPIMPLVKGALFHDFGNVYPTVRQMSITDLRHGIGAGLRLDSPLGLIRLDLGYNLFPRFEESSLVFFLGLGQAF